MTIQDPIPCERCQRPLSSGATHGLCSRCLLLGALEPEEAVGAVGSKNPEATPVLRFFGDYELLHEIARGGMGVVYRARQVRADRIVALKVLAGGAWASPRFVERFHAEARTVAALEHPNIVPIYEVGELGGQPYFTMRLIEGGSLATHLASRGGRVPNREAAAWISRLCRAVHYAHQHGVLHRDLKPGNVLLDERDGPMLTDFGLAKWLEQDSALTRTHALLGTPSYLSPEQATGDGHALTTATDVYGLGAVLYELLAGQPPFVGSTAVETLRRVVEHEPRRPTQIHSGADPDLEVIALKCLEKDPARRYGSAEAVAEELDRWLRGEPILARPAGLWERASKWVRRHPRRALLSAVTTAALLAVVIVPSLMNLRLREANQRARATAEENRRHLVHLHVAHGVELMNDGDLGGSLPWFVQALKLDHGNLDEERIHRIRIAAVLNQMPRLVQLLVHSTNMGNATFSPEGRHVLLHAPESGFVQVWDIATGQPTTQPLRHRAFVESANFDPAGHRVVTCDYDGLARVWNADTGEPAAPEFRHSAGLTSALFTPDGRKVVTGGFEDGLSVWDVANGERVLHLPTPGKVNALACSLDGRWLAAMLDQEVRLWRSADGGDAGRWEFRSSAPGRMISFSLDSKRLLGLGGFLARVWEVDGGKVLMPGVAHPNFWMFGAAFDPSGKQVMSWGRDALARVWSVGSEPSTLPPLRHDHAVRHAEFSPDGLRIVTASDDQTARIWDGQTGELLCSLRHGRRLLRASFSPDGRHLLTMDASMTRIWDLANAAMAGPLLNIPAPHGVGFSASGHQLLTVDAERSVRAWDVATGREQPLSEVEPESPSPVLAYTRLPKILPHPDGQRELVIEEGAVLRRVGSSTSLIPPLRHREDLVTAAFGAEGAMVATSARDRIARVWDAETGMPITPPLRSPATVYQAVFSPDAKRLATTSGAGAVEVWRLETDPRSVEDLEALANLLSGRRIAGSGDLEVLDSASVVELRRRLQSGDPPEFRATPDQQTHWHWRDAVLAGRGDDELAETSKLLDPRFDPARWPWRARYEASQSRWTEAVNSFGQALKLFPNDPLLWQERGRARLQIRQWDQAMQDFGRALDLAPSDANLWFARAQGWWGAGKGEEALQDIDRAIALSAGTSSFHEFRARVATGLRQWDRAVEDYERARALRSKLRMGVGTPPGETFPPRTAEAGPDLVDLGTYFNAALSPYWMVPPEVRLIDGLKDLSVGIARLGAVSFEIRGVVQLAGRESRLRRGTFPSAASGIRIARKCRRLHFLHGTDAELPPGTEVGRVAIHYVAGPSVTTPLAYGTHLAAIFSSHREIPKDPNSAIAWTQDLPGQLRHRTLYRTTWDNPRPDDEVAMIDYESVVARAGPALFAVTVEP